LRCVTSGPGNQPVLRHAEGGSARSQSSVCVTVTPGSNRGPPLWFTALLLRALEGCQTYSRQDGQNCQTYSREEWGSCRQDCQKFPSGRIANPAAAPLPASNTWACRGAPPAPGTVLMVPGVERGLGVRWRRALKTLFSGCLVRAIKTARISWSLSLSFSLFSLSRYEIEYHSARAHAHLQLQDQRQRDLGLSALVS